MFADGTYDAIVFDTSDRDADGIFAVELTITAGEHKGEVVSIRTNAWAGEPFELLGIPATLTVADGEPVVRFEP